jgi:CheY-like chemotaxis protein
VQTLMMRQPTPEIITMTRAVHHLTRLVDDLMDFSRLSRGRLVLAKRPIELAQIVDRALEISSPELEPHRKHAAVSVPRLGWRVDADPERLSRALGHMIVNAAQHSESGASIRIDCERAGERIVMRVIDTGSGIPAVRLEELSRDQPPARTASSEQRGLGLGLAIARGIVALHGGTIELHSAGSGKGTTCMMSLPPSQGMSERPAAMSSSQLPHKRLLLVEDNDDAARALKLALEQLGYEVALAHDGPIAINLARTFHPHVALLDLGLPVMDGWEVARRLRQTTSSLPIVAVTAKDAEADRAQSAQVGFAEHFVKPIDLEQLRRVVESLARDAKRETSS